MLQTEIGKGLETYLVNYVVIGIETTGLAAHNDEIIEMSAVKVKNEEIAEEYDSLVRPTASIPLKISALTGITDSMVWQKPDIENVITDFLEFIGDDVLVCHNAKFHLSFLNEAVKALFGTVIGNEYVDIFHASKNRLTKLHSHTLSALVDYYGINGMDKSGLISDCRMIKEIYERLFHRRKIGDDGAVVFL